jgi:hypothetical protein
MIVLVAVSRQSALRPVSIPEEDFHAIRFDTVRRDVQIAVAIEIGHNQPPGAFGGPIGRTSGRLEAATPVAHKQANGIITGDDQVSLAVAVHVGDLHAPCTMTKLER